MRGRGSAVRIGGLALGLWLSCALLAIPALAHPADFYLESPTAGQSFERGARIVVTGRVLWVNATPLGGASLGAVLVDDRSVPVPGTDVTGVSNSDGTFSMAVDVPTDLTYGSYSLRVFCRDHPVTDAVVPLTVAPPPWWAGTFAGVPVGAWIGIGGGVAAVAGWLAYAKIIRPRRQRPREFD